SAAHTSSAAAYKRQSGCFPHDEGKDGDAHSSFAWHACRETMQARGYDDGLWEAAYKAWHAGFYCPSVQKVIPGARASRPLGRCSRACRHAPAAVGASARMRFSPFDPVTIHERSPAGPTNATSPTDQPARFRAAIASATSPRSSSVMAASFGQLRWEE